LGFYQTTLDLPFFDDVNPIGWRFMNQMKSISKKGVVNEKLEDNSWTTIYWN
jgi:hypothetical protein